MLPPSYSELRNRQLASRNALHAALDGQGSARAHLGVDGGRGVDVRERHPGPDRALPSGRHDRLHAHGGGSDSALDGLSCGADRFQDCVSIGRAGTVGLLHLQAEIRGGIPLSLRNRAGAHAHRQRDVRRDHRRSARAAAGGEGVRARAERGTTWRLRRMACRPRTTTKCWR